MGNGGIYAIGIVVLVSFVILFFSPQLVFADSEKEYLITIKSLKKISVGVSDFAVIELRVINNLDQDLDFSKKDIASLKHSNGKFFGSTATNQLEDEFNIECSVSEALVRSGLTKEILLCFEVSKDDQEEYLLVIDKDKTILDNPKEIQLYLNSHNLPTEFSSFDISSVFLTIRDVKTKSISNYDLLIVDFTVYNGYAPLNRYGEVTPLSVPFDGKKFFVTDLNGNQYSALATEYSNTSYEEYCPKPNDVLSNQYAYRVYCFDIPKSTQKDTEYWLFLNNSPHRYFCGENCQEKMWSLSPFMSSSIMEDKKIPEWVRNIFIWYGEKAISEDDLIGAIQFLIKEGIIKINPQNS